MPEGLAELLKLLPPGSRWQLVVHPSQVPDAAVQVIKARRVGQVLIDGDARIGPDDLSLSAPLAVPRRRWHRPRRRPDSSMTA